MPDPLAPLRPGDPVSKAFSAARHNALADAARTIQGSPPVRWARRRAARGGGSVETVWHYAKLEERLVSGGSAYADIQDEDGNTGNRVRVWGDHMSPYYAIAAAAIIRIDWHDTRGKWFCTGVYS